jgi:hypothetical protein
MRFFAARHEERSAIAQSVVAIAGIARLRFRWRFDLMRCVLVSIRFVVVGRRSISASENRELRRAMHDHALSLSSLLLPIVRSLARCSSTLLRVNRCGTNGGSGGISRRGIDVSRRDLSAHESIYIKAAPDVSPIPGAPVLPRARAHTRRNVLECLGSVQLRNYAIALRDESLREDLYPANTRGGSLKRHVRSKLHRKRR